MIETKEKIIDGDKYTVTQMTARKALRMKSKIVKLFGASIAELLVEGKEKPKKGQAFSKPQMVNAIQMMTEKLEETTLDSLIVELLSNVRKNGIELNEHVIDLEFAGSLETLYKVVWYVLEVNYESFFLEGGIGKLLTSE